MGCSKFEGRMPSFRILLDHVLMSGDMDSVDDDFHNYLI